MSNPRSPSMSSVEVLRAALADAIRERDEAREELDGLRALIVKPVGLAFTEAGHMLAVTEIPAWPGHPLHIPPSGGGRVALVVKDEAAAPIIAQGKYAVSCVEALRAIIKCDDDAKRAKGNPRANLNGYGLVDLFDHVGHPLGDGEHRQQPYRSNNLDAALDDARALLAGNKALEIGRASLWRPIETAPEHEDVLIAQVPSPMVWAAYRIEDEWYFPGDDTSFSVQPTHWMPLPAPPAAPAQSSRDAASALLGFVEHVAAKAEAAAPAQPEAPAEFVCDVCGNADRTPEACEGGKCWRYGCKGRTQRVVNRLAPAINAALAQRADSSPAQGALPLIRLGDGAELRAREGFGGLWLFRGEECIRDLSEFEEDFVRSAFCAGAGGEGNVK